MITTFFLIRKKTTNVQLYIIEYYTLFPEKMISFVWLSSIFIFNIVFACEYIKFVFWKEAFVIQATCFKLLIYEKNTERDLTIIRYFSYSHIYIRIYPTLLWANHVHRGKVTLAPLKFTVHSNFKTISIFGILMAFPTFLRTWWWRCSILTNQNFQTKNNNFWSLPL